MKKALKKLLIALHFAEMNVEDLVTFARSLYGVLFTDTVITTPIVPLPDFKTQIDDVDNTHILRKTDKSTSLTRTEGEQATLVIDSITQIAQQIENYTFKTWPGDTATGSAFIQKYGFQIRKDGGKKGRSFEITATAPGGASMHTKAAKKKAIYLWRWSNSIPPKEMAWSLPILTNEANVTLTGLPGELRTYFQFAIISGQGRKPVIDVNNISIEWSDPISVVIP